MAKSSKENLLKKKEEDKTLKSNESKLETTLISLKEKEAELEEMEKEHLEQLNYINQLKRSEEQLKETLQLMANQL